MSDWRNLPKGSHPFKSSVNTEKGGIRKRPASSWCGLSLRNRCAARGDWLHTDGGLHSLRLMKASFFEVYSQHHRFMAVERSLRWSESETLRHTSCLPPLPAWSGNSCIAFKVEGLYVRINWLLPVYIQPYSFFCLNNQAIELASSVSTFSSHALGKVLAHVGHRDSLRHSDWHPGLRASEWHTGLEV